MVTHYLYGGTALMLEGDWTQAGKLHGLDVIRASFVSGSRTGIVAGAMLPDPLPNMRCSEVETTSMGSLWRHKIEAIGVLSSKSGSLPGYPKRTLNSADWDTYTDKRLTSNRNLFAIGQTGGVGGIFFCTSAEYAEIHPGLGWYEATGNFTGLASNKPRETTITVGGVTSSGDSIVLNLPGGWNTPRKGTVDLPEVVVSQRFLTTSPPPTAALPGHGSPQNAPPVKNIVLGGTDIVQHWPDGWRYDGIDSKQVMNKPLYDTTIRYRYAHKYTW